jgi:hypothetical protein
MKTYKMTRIYETYIEVEDNQELGSEIYAMELEQCNVVQERIELESDTCNTNKQKDIKRMIIENFMLWYTGELTEEMQDSIYEYVEDDHVNELTK